MANDFLHVCTYALKRTYEYVCTSIRIHAYIYEKVNDYDWICMYVYDFKSVLYMWVSVHFYFLLLLCFGILKSFFFFVHIFCFAFKFLPFKESKIMPLFRYNIN